MRGCGAIYGLPTPLRTNIRCFGANIFTQWMADTPQTLLGCGVRRAVCTPLLFRVLKVQNSSGRQDFRYETPGLS